MVKSKKLSRGSLAVLLLALLLALSMVVGMTGAWFTDKTSGGSNNTNDQRTFGSVALTESENGFDPVGWTATATEGDPQMVVPGSSYQIRGGTVTNSGTIEAWVYVGIENIKVTVTGYALTGSPEGEAASFVKNYTKANEATTWVLQTLDSEAEGYAAQNTLNTAFASYINLPHFDLVTTAGNADRVVASESGYEDLYDLAVGKFVEFSAGTITIAATTPNVITISGNKYTLEGGTILVEYQVVVRAIQKANVSAAEAYYMLTDGWTLGVPTQSSAPAPANP